MLSATVNLVSAQSKPSAFTHIDGNTKNYQNFLTLLQMSSGVIK